MGGCKRNCWTCGWDREGGICDIQENDDGREVLAADTQAWACDVGIDAFGMPPKDADGCPGWAPRMVTEGHRNMREQIRAEFMELHRQTQERPFRIPDVLLTDIRLPLPGSSAEPVSVPHDTVPWPISRAEWMGVLSRLHDLERRVRAVEDPDGTDLSY